MKPLVLAVLAAASVAAVAAPAAAQPFDRGFGGGDIRERESRIAERIDRGEMRGDLTRREAYRLREDLRDIESLERRYRFSDGFINRWERNDLDRRLDDLSQRVSEQRHDEDRRRPRFDHYR